ncbi:Myb-like DNA-binding domain containing protein [Tritrichomonas foetus]|uniref:Myb-like DNA-binding domain containing protein n=1 Tax=Tritrichomonas foetus TaxID=1144522 RepID=A0A1J4KNS8_9EUKA|nr:Myb-like DNA-binding domain containing protein [Tritrichomonas foetus]|eukprot:OHT12945.1 Myb-like DNA-binding domain containing protein [Tritrichomonas foetus]
MGKNEIFPNTVYFKKENSQKKKILSNSMETPHHPTRCRSHNPVKKSHTRWSPADDASLTAILSNTNEPNWDQIALKFPGKTQQQVADRWNKVLNPELVKGSWSPEEDAFIIQWVQEHGARNWSTLAANLPGRLGKQCRERWVNSLDPDLLRKPWTEDEDQILIRYQKMWGNKWAKIAHFLPGRTDNSVKNRWNSSLKRKLERIAKGQNPVQKRGRKPKRPSTAPDVVNEEVPKPDFESMELNVTTQPPTNSPLMGLSPILSTESPLFTLFSPGTPWNFRSPGTMSMKSPMPFFLKSPTAGGGLALQSPLPFSLEPADQPTQN